MGNIRNCVNKMLLAVVGLSAAFGCVALHADETDKDQDQKVRPFLNCDASLKFENEHISLGRFGGRQMLIPKVKIYHELNDSVITYIGTDVFASIKHGPSVFRASFMPSSTSPSFFKRIKGIP